MQNPVEKWTKCLQKFEPYLCESSCSEYNPENVVLKWVWLTSSRELCPPIQFDMKIENITRTRAQAQVQFNFVMQFKSSAWKYPFDPLVWYSLFIVHGKAPLTQYAQCTSHIEQPYHCKVRWKWNKSPQISGAFIKLFRSNADIQ